MQRLQEDHDNAAWMAEQLRAIGADVTRHDTNMLFVRVGEEQAPALGKFMQAQGVLINASPVVRLVTHTDVNRQQLSEVVAHWQAFYNAKESGVSQSVLVLGASGYIGQHLVRELSARGYPVLAAARHIDRLQNSLCPALPAGQSISINRRTCLRYSPVSIPFIIWSTAWAKAVILSPMSGGWRRMCAMPCVSHQCAVIFQFAAGPGAGAIRPSARSSDYRRSPA